MLWIIYNFIFDPIEITKENIFEITRQGYEKLNEMNKMPNRAMCEHGIIGVHICSIEIINGKRKITQCNN